MKASELLSVQKINKIIHSVPSSGRSIVSAVIRRVGRSISHFRWFRVFWKCARDFNSIWIKSFNSSERNLWNFFFVWRTRNCRHLGRDRQVAIRHGHHLDGRVEWGCVAGAYFRDFFVADIKKNGVEKRAAGQFGCQWQRHLTTASVIIRQLWGGMQKFSSALQCDSIINLVEWMANFWTSQTLTCPPFSTPRHSHYWG